MEEAGRHRDDARSDPYAASGVGADRYHDCPRFRETGGVPARQDHPLGPQPAHSDAGHCSHRFQQQPRLSVGQLCPHADAHRGPAPRSHRSDDQDGGTLSGTSRCGRSIRCGSDSGHQSEGENLPCARARSSTPQRAPSLGLRLRDHPGTLAQIGARNRAQAVRYAYEHGLAVSPSTPDSQAHRSGVLPERLPRRELSCLDGDGKGAWEGWRRAGGLLDLGAPQTAPLAASHRNTGNDPRESPDVRGFCRAL